MRYFAPGKLLLSGEYAVLDGAKAISCPTQKGQFLDLQATKNASTLEWVAQEEDGKTWLSLRLSADGEIIEASDFEKADLVKRLVWDAFDGEIPVNLKVVSQLNFNRQWGLGSSSTLIALLSAWSGKDALPLFFKHLKGSGYDIATAIAGEPIAYRLLGDGIAEWEKIALPTILKQSFFLYLGQKQISSREVKRYQDLPRNPELISQISALSEKLLRLDDSTDLIEWMREHEAITAGLISQKSIRDIRFPKLKGGFKSLGAWGGDFVWIMPLEDDLKYLNSLGYKELFSFSEMLSLNI